MKLVNSFSTQKLIYVYDSNDPEEKYLGNVWCDGLKNWHYSDFLNGIRGTGKNREDCLEKLHKSIQNNQIQN